MTTSGHTPPDQAAVKTLHFPMNPPVSGMPANDSMNSANDPASSGELLPRPAQRERCVVSPPESRTSVTTANAPIEETP